MERKKINQLTLFFEKSDSDAAEWIGRTAEESLRLVRDDWDLAPSGALRVYVMKSWPHFLLHSAPWPWRIMLGLTFPLWALRVRRLWRVAGGWMQRYGQRLAVGVKPPRLIRSGDRSMGELIFLPEENMKEKIRQLTCHEVTHACTAHLKLPAWLNEGLAMVMVDRLLKKPTVRAGTAVSLANVHASSYRRKYPAFSASNREEFIRYYVLGYWRVRFLEETRPGLVKKLLAENYRPGEWREPLAAAYQLGHESIWTDLDRSAAAHFQNTAGG
jgi:hypothetical protein